MSASLREQFDRDGYILIRGVLNPSEVAEVRKEITHYWNETRGKNPSSFSPRCILTSEVLALSSVYLIPLREKIVKALKEVLGEEFYYLPDIEIQRNHFSTGGWHFDAGSEKVQPYFFSSEYRFVKCGIYLQDNTEDWGGGVQVVPGSHRIPGKGLPSPVRLLTKKVRDRLRISRKKTIPVELRAGDFLFFHSFLWHAPTWPHRFMKKPAGEAGFVLDLPPEHSKWVLYWDASQVKAHADAFLVNSQRRAEEELKTGNKSDIFFLNYLRLQFPRDYPESYSKLLKEKRCRLAMISDSLSEQWNQKYQSFLNA